MRAELQAFLSYPARDRLLLLQAWWLLLGLDLALRTLPFRRVQDWVEPSRWSKNNPAPGQAEVDIPHTSDFLDRAARHHLYPMTCLRRSLALQWLLSRQGLDTSLQFGVRRENGRLQAHAWLEYQGQVIGDTRLSEEQYARLKAKGAV